LVMEFPRVRFLGGVCVWERFTQILDTLESSDKS
jgi:hypothetical protein